jgi:hypothetical protein
VVTNDLHYTACLANYVQRRNQGLDVRIVKHRDWQIDLRDVERAVDHKTRLIAISLVSSVNGYFENVKALSELAHAHGGYLFADIIQGAGAVPIDVKAMGIDFASCAMYKWLQGEHGFGFLYIREDLAGPVVTHHVHRKPGFNYPPWVAQRNPVCGPRRKAPAWLPSVRRSFRDHLRRPVRILPLHRRIGVAAFRRTLASSPELRNQLRTLGFTPITPRIPAPHRHVPGPGHRGGPAQDPRAARTGRARISITGPNSAHRRRFGNHSAFRSPFSIIRKTSTGYSMSFPENPATLVREPPEGLLKSLRYLGPGFILSAAVVGSGELIATTASAPGLGSLCFG